MINSRQAIVFFKSQPRWRLIVAGLLVLLAGFWLFHGSKSTAALPTFAARRGPLDITVLEGGSIKAIESQEIKCEVRVGYQGTKILRIVPEGYFVTDDDVRTNKVLCELDSSDLQNRLVQQEIQYQTALASLADAEQNYQIQLGQNDSDIKAAQQTARFARMDFEKYLGDNVADTVIAQVGLDRIFATISSNNIAAAAIAAVPETGGLKKAAPSKTSTSTDLTTNTSAAKPIKVALTDTNSAVAAADPPDDPAAAMVSENDKPLVEIPDIILDFTKYATLNALGDGEAKQKLRQLDDALQTAQKDLGQASTTLDGTRRLFDKGFVAKTEITRDEISYDSAVLKVKSSQTDRALFLSYEFPRTAEEDLTKYAEAVRALDKADHAAISRLAQARARLNSAKGQYQVQLQQKQDLEDQVDKCVLVAKKSGLVVYGGDDQNFYGNQEPIREGATVRERQTIITIPDLRLMSVVVKIHESYIKKIKVGQKARITVDAYPDQPLTGTVTNVGVLPDSQNRWLNPDLKVYLTTVTIDGTNTWLKPGMSAKVEILVDHLDNVVYVPVQCVEPGNGKQFCFVAGSFNAPERREAQVGEFNDDFIEVKSGLKEGDRVLLNPPEIPDSEQAPIGGKPTPPEPKRPSNVAAQPAQPART
jgi:HlyD family secretion protein